MPEQGHADAPLSVATAVAPPPAVRAALRKYWGFDTLRPLQGEAIAAAIARRDSLVILPTGGGKSLCYQVPPLVTGKLTVVLSPLIALMKDQVDGMRLAGYPAAALHSGVSASEQADIRRKLAAGELRLLLVAPERLLGGTDESGGAVGSALLSQLARLDSAGGGAGGLGGFAIDEAHCISQWGHDFRPEYRRLSELRTIFPNAPIQAYTATATPQVRDDIIHALDLRDPAVLVGCFDRPNLTYRILPRVGSGDQQIADILRRHTGDGVGNAAIVYCMSRKETERLAGLLSLQGIRAEAYHAGLDHAKRHRVQEDFLNDRLNVVCATVAFGMGIDRGDVRCVIHAASPKSVEAYQQETGRAGRDGLPAECVLLYSSADEVRWCQLVDRSAAESDVDVSPEVVAAQKELIKQMHSLAKGAQCRHKALSEHFGQTYVPPPAAGTEDAGCAACDVCLRELDEIEGSQTIAQKIVSCVARLRGPSGTASYGSAYVVDVLRGSGQAKVLERGHHTLSTFGILRDLPKDVLASCVAQLVDAGALEREAGEFPVLTLGPKAAAVLKGTHLVRLLRQKSAPEEAAERKRGGASRGRAAFGTPSVKLDLSADERALFDHLRQLRKEIAAGMGMPPYVVFGDTALEEMARVRPGSLSSFAGIRGVGQAKLEQFGGRFVAAITRYCQDHGLALDAAAGSRPRPGLVERVEAAAPAPLSAGSKGAAAMFDRGSSVEEVCAATGRAPSTVRGYLEDYVREMKPASIGAWVDTRTYERVVQAFERTGAFALKPAFEELGGEVAYDTIRLVLTHKRAVTGA